jgi:hypothetical protein
MTSAARSMSHEARRGNLIGSQRQLLPTLAGVARSVRFPCDSSERVGRVSHLEGGVAPTVFITPYPFYITIQKKKNKTTNKRGFGLNKSQE